MHAQCIQNCVCFMERTTDGNKLSAKFGLFFFFAKRLRGLQLLSCETRIKLFECVF